MIRWIVGSSLKFRLLVIPVAAALIVVGVVRLRHVPVDVMPEFNPPSVQIQTEALGLSAEEVEQFVTVPMEQDLLNGVPWLDHIRSDSVVGLSTIDLVFNPGTDILRARQMVQERLTQAVALPHVSKAPVMLQPVSSTSRVMMVGLSSSDLSLIDMSVLARWRIKPRLMGVPGVANVSIWGQRERQLQVQVDPNQLAANGVTLTQVITTTGNALWVSPLTFVEASTPGTGGFIDTPNQRLSIQHVLPIRTAQDLAQVRVEDTPQDKPLRLGDVAQVVEDHQPLIGDAVVDGAPGLMLVVEKFPEANTLDVTRGVEEALDGMKPGLSGIKIDTNVYRPATLIEKTVGTLGAVLLLSLLLVIVLLCLLFLDWRAALISLAAIGLSVVAAALVLQLRGGTVNIVVLAGLVLALGVIADDAVVEVDHLRRRLREHQGSTTATVIDASLRTRGPLLYAMLVLLVLAAPFLFLPGVTGAFSRPLAISFMVAVLASTVIALTVTPALALVLLARAPERREPPFTRWVRRGYEMVMTRASNRPRAVFAAIAVLLLAGLAVLPLLGGRPLLPPIHDRSIVISLTGTPGTSGTEMARMASQASAELRTIPGVHNVGAHVGRAITSDETDGVNASELWLTIDSAADYDRTVSRIREVVDGYPGFARDVTDYPEQQIKEATTGAGGDVVVRVYGPDLAVLRAKAEEVRRLLAGTKGVVAPKVDLPPDEPTIQIEVNLAAAQKYGIRPGDVRRDTAILLSGLQAGNLFEDQKVFDVVVWGVPAARASVTSIRDLVIDTPDGGHIRLGDVADVSIKPNPTIIRHDSVSRRVDVVANVRGRGIGAVEKDIRAQIAGMTFATEYHAELLGLSAQRANVRNLAWGLTAAALILALLLLQAAFGSWRLAAAFLFALPLALAGGALVALAAGVGVTLGSLVGAFLVVGVAVRNGVLLIRHYQGMDEPPSLGLVLRGTEERVAPILTTAAVIAVALAPLVLLGGVAGAEVLYPLALVVLGGLVTSTVLSLFIVPVLYLLFAPDREPAPDRGPEQDRRPGPEPDGNGATSIEHPSQQTLPTAV
jgi:CzcA family heavy metal efflux pump